GLRRSPGPPPDRGLLGAREPRRPAGRLRRGQALRRGDGHGLPPLPRRRRPHRPHLQHVRARDATLRRAGGVELPRAGARRQAAHRLRRRQPDPQLLLRRRRGARHRRAPRLRPRRAREHRQPERVHRARAGRAGARRRGVVVGNRPRAAARRRPGGAAARHIARAASAGLGAGGGAARRPRPHGGVVPPPARNAELTDIDAVEGRRYRTLSVIVPVFNERNTVAEILRRMRRVELPVDLEVVVVDDASSDGTDKILDALADSTVRVVRHPVNRGKGAAVRTGLDYVRGDLVLVQDADLEYDPEDWPRLLAPILKGKARVVYGSRFTGERKNMLFLHWVGNRFLSLVTNVLYNTTLSDMET